MHLLISGGFAKKNHAKQEEGFKYVEAFLLEMDWATGDIGRKLIYRSPIENRAPEASMQFKSGTRRDSKLYVPTGTEIVEVCLGSFSIQRVITSPTFSDLHHVNIGSDDNFYLANTGLEMIQVLSPSGEILSEHGIAPTPTWKRFDRSIDYRFVGSTKPHEVHANYVFFVDDEPWFTRFHQRDAVSLRDSSRRIDLHVSDGMPHDGKVVGDYIYFTVTDGYLVVVDKFTLKIASLFDLNEMSGKSEQLGWCRGIEVVGETVCVGFSKLRQSLFREYGRWVVKGQKPLPSRIAKYDLEKRCLVSEHPIGKETGAAIFTVMVS